MNIIFLGGFFPKQFTDNILDNSINQVQHSANRFQWAFISGLEQNLPRPLKLLTAPFIGWYPKYYKELFFKASSFPHQNNSDGGFMAGFINLPTIKNVFKFFNLKNQLTKLLLPEKNVIIVYSLDTAYLKAAIAAKKEYPDTKVCVIVPDLHEFPGDSSIFYAWYIKYIEKPLFYSLVAHIDAFVVLTDKMGDYLNINNKPWVRIEGLYENTSGQLSTVDINTGEEKVILYTGTLDFKYGIGELLDAFSLIKDPDYRLWICGGGVGVNRVKDAVANDIRIQYFGIVPMQRVAELQSKATLLINPRNTVGEYNKYSFPSKTMEYFASGKPVLLYKLEGMPAEYFNYCYTIADNEVKTLSETMYQVCQLDAYTLAKKGEEARNFILKYKNSKTQCRKVVDMLQQLSQ